MRTFDYIIVGAGPTGLTLASLLPKHKTKLIVDKNSTIGGCHRVTRVNNIVTEHGPRVYSDAYVNMKWLLASLGLPFDFTKYRHQITSLIGDIPIGPLEYAKLALYGFSSVPVIDIISDFSDESKEFITRLCLLTDGAGPDRYPMHKLGSLVNQQAFYSLLQPTAPMDICLFNQWEKLLETDHSCTFLLNSEAKSPGSGTIFINNVKYTAQTILLATVPWLFPELFDQAVQWNRFKYQDYISVMLWYKEDKQLLKDWGFPKSEWGIAYIELSDYWKTKKGTHLSTCITLLDRPSKQTGLTAKQTPDHEIAAEIVRQLSLPNPDFTHIYKHDDTAWISDVKIGPETKDPTVFSIGTHNQKSNYNFTSFESAVSNAMAFCDVTPSRSVEVTDLLIAGLTIFLLLLVRNSH